MDKKILIIEDEKHIRELMENALLKEGYKVIVTSNGKEGFNTFLSDEEINLVILDILLSEMHGWSVLNKIKKERQVPVIMLTSRPQVSDESFGNEISPDEYITKPFNMNILKNRIRILFNKYRHINTEIINLDWVKLDLNNKKMFIDNEAVELTDIEFDLVVYLVQNRNVALTRKKILINVWGKNNSEDERIVDYHINRLRKKINNHSDQIKTVRGVGYTFEV